MTQGMIAEPQNVDKEIVTWLRAQVAADDILLAHADDGVIWGRVVNGALVTAYEAAGTNAGVRQYCTELRVETLQQARLFSAERELLVWRDDANPQQWHAVRLIDNPNHPNLHQNDFYLLWGTGSQDAQRQLAQSFTLMVDGEQGLRHVVPLQPVSDKQHARLAVRHYWEENDETGFTRIVASRLIGLDAVAAKE